MYIFLYPDGEIEVRDTWDVDYKPPVDTYVYEPSDTIWPWTIQRPNGPVHLSNVPPQCKAIELLYPRATHTGFVYRFPKHKQVKPKDN